MASLASRLFAQLRNDLKKGGKKAPAKKGLTAQIMDATSAQQARRAVAEGRREKFRDVNKEK